MKDKLYMSLYIFIPYTSSYLYFPSSEGIVILLSLARVTPFADGRPVDSGLWLCIFPLKTTSDVKDQSGIGAAEEFEHVMSFLEDRFILLFYPFLLACFWYGRL